MCCVGLSRSVKSNSFWIHGLWPTRLLCAWDSPGKNTGVGCHALLQGIFPTQGSNPSLPHCRWILYHLSHQGSPRILEWVAHPFSRYLSNPGIKTELQADSLLAELPGKSKYIWNGSDILAWRIPWTEETGGLQSTGSQRVGPDWATNTFIFHIYIYKYIWLNR